MRRGEAFIVGIGATEFSTCSQRSELQLTLEATRAALADANLSVDAIDALVTYQNDSSDPLRLAYALGLDEVRFFAQTSYGGGGACATLQQAALAVQSGSAEAVVVYRGLNGRSKTRYGQPTTDSPAAYFPYSAPQGLLVPGHRFALAVHRYMHEYGLRNEDFAPISVAARGYAATNPSACFYQRPITIEDHQSSAWVAEPVLRVLDCCLETDGAVACIVTGGELARSLADRPVRILASSCGLVGEPEIASDFYRPVIGRLPESAIVAKNLWKQSGLSPDEIDVAILYDHFSPYVILQLEAFSFCKPGEGAHFVADGQISREGSLPVNPNGGQLGEGYVHGLNGVCEAVRQIRGGAANQIPDVEHVLVTGGPGLPSSGVILSAD
ncbi:MAG TPA: lipid-transfer protein [Myxococcota bacterium]|nr:lipid-transfer protein [Myxococcota bacterium]